MMTRCCGRSVANSASVEVQYGVSLRPSIGGMVRARTGSNEHLVGVYFLLGAITLADDQSVRVFESSPTFDQTQCRIDIQNILVFCHAQFFDKRCLLLRQ